MLVRSWERGHWFWRGMSTEDSNRNSRNTSFFEAWAIEIKSRTLVLRSVQTCISEKKKMLIFCMSVSYHHHNLSEILRGEKLLHDNHPMVVANNNACEVNWTVRRSSPRLQLFSLFKTNYLMRRLIDFLCLRVDWSVTSRGGTSDYSTSQRYNWCVDVKHANVFKHLFVQV